MLSTKLKGTLAGAILATGLAASATTAEAANFAVNNTNSSGAGSLRSAINAAEGTAAADTITFSIPGAGPHTITPATPLPTITRPLKIKGYTEPGASAATANSSAVIMIIIDAVNVARGLDIGGDDIEVRGLNIQRAQGTGVFVEGRDNVVAGNFIGTGVAGLVARPNGDYGVERARPGQPDRRHPAGGAQRHLQQRPGGGLPRQRLRPRRPGQPDRHRRGRRQPRSATRPASSWSPTATRSATTSSRASSTASTSTPTTTCCRAT